MFDAYGRTVAFGLVRGIAEALREEFGADIDAHPGGPGTEAGQVNRAYRVVARYLFQAIVPTPQDLSGLVSWALRQAARFRLIEARLSGPARTRAPRTRLIGTRSLPPASRISRP